MSNYKNKFSLGDDDSVYSFHINSGKSCMSNTDFNPSRTSSFYSFTNYSHAVESFETVLLKHLQNTDKNDSLLVKKSQLLDKVNVFDNLEHLHKFQDVCKAASFNNLKSATATSTTAVYQSVKQLQDESLALRKTGKRRSLSQLSPHLTKFPGIIYHLYERSDGEQYLSMLSVKDWHYNPPSKYIGSYRLNDDNTWTSTHHVKDVKQHNCQTHSNPRDFSSLVKTYRFLTSPSLQSQSELKKDFAEINNRQNSPQQDQLDYDDENDL